MRTRSYASVRHLHFVEDLEYHFVDGYGELINTSTNVNIFEHKKYQPLLVNREPVLNEAGNLWKPKYVSHLPINFKYFGLT